MNHKRRRSKNQRAGCLMCKPNKMCGAKAVVRDSPAVKRASVTEREQLADDGYDDVPRVIWEEEQDEIDWDEQELRGRLFHPGGWLRRSASVYAEGSFATIGDAIGRRE